ncbi:MAG TPA: hypothetical protein VGF97_15420 [Rhizomicrobium sp.]|jgi:uncharacterized protein YjlB
MSLIENVKKTIEHTTGLGRPSDSQLKSLIRPCEPVALRFKDDGRTPNSPQFPLLLYRSAFGFLPGLDPAAIIEEIFAHNGWKGSWRDGVYPFLHFHTATHETLGLARGKARIQFGGSKGQTMDLKAGDAMVLPAGTGHRRMSASKDLLVVGAYPAGGRYDEPRPKEVDHDEAVAMIAKVRRPASDPVYGKTGPLLRLWPSDR